MLVTPFTRWPSHVPVEPQKPPIPGPDEVVVTFIGHATFLIQSPDATVLVDPVYARRAGPLPFVGPVRVRAPGVRFEDLPPISTVLQTHNHYDHCDLRALRRLERSFHPKFVTPLGNARLLRSAGASRIVELDWWETDGAVTVTPAQHFSARTPFDRNRALWGGFLIEIGGRRILHAGDSGYGPHFREIGTRLAPIDLALLPIGAYEPRWFMKDIHMDPAERFRPKARAFCREHQDHVAIQKLRMNRPLTATDLEELERILAEAGVGGAEDINQAKAESQGLGLFVRSLVGMDRGAARTALAGFLDARPMKANQIEFVNLVVDQLTDHGVMPASLLYESPFTDISRSGPEGLFTLEEVEELVGILDRIRDAAVAA